MQDYRKSKNIDKIKGIVLLWALRSTCNLRCRYCYFKNRKPLHHGELSRSEHNDVSIDVILKFIESFRANIIRRVFIVGGEPLLWKGTFQVISALKGKGIDVIVSTNSLPLLNEKVSAWLINTNVDAISVSLDSYDSKYNDRYRVDPSGRGWHGEVEGLRALLRKRREVKSHMKVGVYSVITRYNIDHIPDTGRLISELGADYFIFQPVSLPQDHPLYAELSLNTTHYSQLLNAIDVLKSTRLKIYLPNNKYLKLLLQTLTQNPPRIIHGCFGGRSLFFIEPDGSVWDCPSRCKIASTSSNQYLTIIKHSADEVFSTDRRTRIVDCPYFSEDCVNMWQLMEFNGILGK